MKRKIKIVVFESESCGYDLPEIPDEFIQWWVDKFSIIPEEHKESAFVECSTVVDYDCAQFEVEIGYFRLETNEEESNRLNADSIAKNRVKKRELNELKRLQDKYGQI